MDLVVHESPHDVAIGAASRISSLLEQSEGRATLGLAGGSTPAATYDALREESVAWDVVDVWLSDERWVPHRDERSNGRMAAETLLDHVDARFLRPEWSDDLSPAAAADRYESTLRSIHAEHRPDLILLGVGEDAHTASLFPGSSALSERERWFVANEIPETGEPRLTATYPLLWGARRLMVITAGAQKARALRDSFEGSTPAGHLGDGEAEVEWHVDRAAASLLS